MADKQYDFKTLVQTYIETQRKYHFHDDFKDYYSSLLHKLEEIFQIKLSSRDCPDTALWMLFAATVSSYLSIASPYDGFSEMGGIIIRLQKLNGLGSKILDEGQQIVKLAHVNQELHLQMLYDLFQAMYGKTDTIFTSDELRIHGFDDSTEPNMWDSKYDDLH